MGSFTGCDGFSKDIGALHVCIIFHRDSIRASGEFLIVRARVLEGHCFTGFTEFCTDALTKLSARALPLCKAFLTI